MEQLTQTETDYLKQRLEVRAERLLKLIRLNAPPHAIGNEMALLTKTAIHLLQDNYIDHLVSFIIRTERASINLCVDCGDKIPLTAPSDQTLCVACDEGYKAEERLLDALAKEEKEEHRVEGNSGV